MHHLVEHGSDGLVVCGTTGEAATLDDEEHLRVIELAVSEMRGRCTIVAGVGSNDTRHAVQPHRAGDRARPDALLSASTRTTTVPAAAGSSRHYQRGGARHRPADPALQHPQRTGEDMPNDLLAELAQLDHIAGVKQANPANLAPVDGLRDLRRRRRDAGRCAGARRRRGHPHRQPRVRRARCAGWSTSPSAGARSTPRCRTPTGTWGSRRGRAPSRPRSTCIGMPVGGPAPALRRARRRRDRGDPSACSSATACSQTARA